MNYLDELESSIIIQKEIDKCNQKMKKYEKKYNSEKKEKLQIIYDYLNNQLKRSDFENFDEFDKKIIMDDLSIIIKHLD
jgi:hypothetical protein